MSAHVCSRNYRAPEIILLEKDYGQAMDTWGLGCILAQLLQQVLENKESEGTKRKSNAEKMAGNPIFPGDTCYPLTPLRNVALGYIDYNDQLRHILDFVREPDALDLAFISEPNALQYVRNICSLTLREQQQPAGGE